MPIGSPPQDLVDQIAKHADEQVRDVFKRMASLNAEAVAKKVEMLLEHKDWRAVEAGIKLRAKLAGDFAPEVVSVTPQRAEDLGGMDEVLAQIPQDTLLALIAKTRHKENGE